MLESDVEDGWMCTAKIFVESCNRDIEAVSRMLSMNSIALRHGITFQVAHVIVRTSVLAVSVNL